jgi:hypothetical protein
VLLAVAHFGLPAWGAVDAAAHPDTMWRSAGLDRSTWVKRLAFTAPFGIGFGFAVMYFAKIRPRLEMAPSVHELEVVDAPSIEPVGTPTVDG